MCLAAGTLGGIGIRRGFIGSRGITIILGILMVSKAAAVTVAPEIPGMHVMDGSVGIVALTAAYFFFRYRKRT